MAKRTRGSESTPDDGSEERKKHLKIWISEKELKVIRMVSLLSDQTTTVFGREAILKCADEVLKKHGVSIE